MKERFSSLHESILATLVMATLAFAIAVAIPGIGLASGSSSGVKCEQKTGAGYTTCVGDALGACTTNAAGVDTNGATCGDTGTGGNCTCGSAAKGCLCRT